MSYLVISIVTTQSGTMCCSVAVEMKLKEANEGVAELSEYLLPVERCCHEATRSRPELNKPKGLEQLLQPKW